MGVVVDSFAGSVRIEFDHEAAFTPLGQLPFFIDFLKTGGLFEAFVADCPLRHTSPNAPKKRDVLGTAMLSMLAGHKRYAHIAALRGDGVLPELLDMSKIVSEGAVRRAFAAIEEEAGANWIRAHLDHCVEPLLSEPWILDVDTTVKPLYGHQEGAVVGYNPKKPGRPSHCYHTYSMAGTRLVLDVDVSAGDEHTSNHSAPGLWALLDRTPRDCWPSLLRGDKGFGNEGIMAEAERRALPYLFKLRLTANVKRAIERLSRQSDWADSGQGWQAKETEIRLQGWSRQRRAVRRRSLRPATVVAGYRRALTSPMCAGFALVNGLVFAGLFAYVNTSPLLFIDGYGVSKAAFGGLFAMTASGVIAGSLINTWLVRRHARPRAVLDAALALVSLAALALVTASLAGFRSPLFVVAPVMVYITSFGLIVPSGAHEAVHPLPENAGLASAILLAAQMLFGALGGAFAAALYRDGSPLAIGLVMTAGALGAGALYGFWLRPGVET